jgi:hypothetical protein
LSFACGVIRSFRFAVIEELVLFAGKAGKICNPQQVQAFLCKTGSTLKYSQTGVRMPLFFQQSSPPQGTLNNAKRKVNCQVGAAILLRILDSGLRSLGFIPKS